MKDLNKVQLTGHVGAEPEVRHADNGTIVTKFTVASNRRWTDQQGAAQEETEWFNVVTFNRLAEIAGDYLTKGAHVYIEGRLHTRQYDDPDSGQKRYWIEVIANDLIMLDKRADRDDDDERDERPATRQEDRREQAPERRERTIDRRNARTRVRAADVL